MSNAAARLTLLVAAASALCACGGSAASATATPAALDRCVVGSWRTDSITGALTAGGANVQLAGGAGELLTVRPDGSLTIDDSATAPVLGTAGDGATYRLTQTGTAGGRIVIAAGRLTVTVADPSRLTTTVARNGVVVASQHPVPQSATYQCSPGARLTITSTGGTVSQFSAAG